MNLLIEGWKNITHSFAMVNQYQILELARIKNMNIYHHDIPHSFRNWQPGENGSGFDEEDQQILDALPSNPPADLDAIYRIHTHYNLSPIKRGQLLVFVVTEFGLDNSEFNTEPGKLKESIHNFEASAGMIVTPSEWSRQRIIHFGFNPEHVKVIPHGANQKYFYPMLAEQRLLKRRALGYHDDEVLLLNVGVATWNKGIDILIHAFGAAHKLRKNLRLILKDQRSIYNVNTESFIIKILDSCHLLTDDVMNAITIIPKNLSLYQLRQLYGVVDCYISPYRAEGFNLPVIEALACGTPAVVTQGGATDEFIVPDLTITIPGKKIENSAVRGVFADAYIEPELDAVIQTLLNVTQKSNEEVVTPHQQPVLFSWDAPIEKLLNIMTTTIAMNHGQQSRILHIYCDGGFGNRFNSLVSGLVIAEAAGLIPVVIWPINNWCGAAYDEIFTSGPLVINRELATYVPEKDNFHFLMCEDHLQMGVPYVSPLMLPDWPSMLNYIRASDLNIFYYTALIPSCLNHKAILRQIRALPLRLDLVQRAENFIYHQNLTSFFGVQIRKTDFGDNGADEHNLYTLIEKSPDHNFFVCSDDETIEAYFRTVANVHIHNKRAYVEKRIDGSWCTLTADYSGRVYPCNVHRSASSVVDAVIDLLILAKSKIIKTSHSTFLTTALLLQEADFPMQTRCELSFFETIHNLGLPAPQGILQLGAGAGRDLRYFLDHNIVHGVFVEPLLEPFSQLSAQCRQIPNYVAVQTLCGDERDKTCTFHVASNSGKSSSILQPLNQRQVFPEVLFDNNLEMVATTVDDLTAFLIDNGYAPVVAQLDFMYLDTNGAELMILRGANHTLKQIKYILVEIMQYPLYEGQPTFLDLCYFLDIIGFVPSTLNFNRDHTGRALFINHCTIDSI